MDLEKQCYMSVTCAVLSANCTRNFINVIKYCYATSTCWCQIIMVYTFLLIQCTLEVHSVVSSIEISDSQFWQVVHQSLKQVTVHCGIVSKEYWTYIFGQKRLSPYIVHYIMNRELFRTQLCDIKSIRRYRLKLCDWFYENVFITSADRKLLAFSAGKCKSTKNIKDTFLSFGCCFFLL